MDVAIDCCLHNALFAVTTRGEQQNQQQGVDEQEQNVLANPTQALEILRTMSCSLPDENKYLGSFFAWGTGSVYNIVDSQENLEKESFDWNYIYGMLAIPASFPCCLVYPIGGFVGNSCSSARSGVGICVVRGAVLCGARRRAATAQALQQLREGAVQDLTIKNGRVVYLCQ